MQLLQSGLYTENYEYICRTEASYPLSGFEHWHYLLLVTVHPLLMSKKVVAQIHGKLNIGFMGFNFHFRVEYVVGLLLVATSFLLISYYYNVFVVI